MVNSKLTWQNFIFAPSALTEGALFKSGFLQSSDLRMSIASFSFLFNCFFFFTAKRRFDQVYLPDSVPGAVQRGPHDEEDEEDEVGVEGSEVDHLEERMEKMGHGTRWGHQKPVLETS